MKEKEIKLIEEKLSVYNLPVGVVVGMIEGYNAILQQWEHDVIFGTGKEEPNGIIQAALSQNTYYETDDGLFTYYVNEKTGEKKFKLEEGDVLVEHKPDDFSR